MSIQIPSDPGQVGGVTSDPTNDPQAPTPTTFDGGDTPTDTLSADGPDAPFMLLNVQANSTQALLLDPPRISLREYSTLLETTAGDLSEQEFDNMYHDTGLYRNLKLSGLITAQYLTSLRKYLKGSSEEWIQLTADQNTAINNYNSANTTYQGAVTSAQANMNAAIAAYNNGTMTDLVFNTNVTAYNNAIATATNNLTLATDAYRLAVTGTPPTQPGLNDRIIALNQQRAGLGLPLIPLMATVPDAPLIPTQAPAPLTLPVPDVVPPTYPPTLDVVVGPTSQDVILDEFYSPVAENFEKQSKQLSDRLENNELLMIYRNFFLSDLKPVANAFTPRNPLISTAIQSGDTSTSGSGVGLTQLMLGQHVPAASGNISTMIWTQQLETDKLPLEPHVFDQIAFAGLELLARAGLGAGSAATRLLYDKIPFLDFRGSPTAVALNIGNINAILQLIQGGATKEVALALLQKAATNGEIDASTLEKLATLLGSTINVQLLQFALFQTSVTLGTPGLLPQILGLVLGTEEMQAILDKDQDPLDVARTNPEALAGAIEAAADALLEQQGLTIRPEDELSGQILENQLLENQIDATNLQYTLQQAQLLSANVITDVINQANLDSDNLQSQLAAAFQAKGLQEAEAVESAAAFYDYLNAELSSSYLNAALVQKDLEADMVAGEVIGEAEQMQIQLNRIALEDSIERRITEANTLRTLRDARDLTALSLQEQGIDRSTALSLSNAAIDNIGSQNPLTLTVPGLPVQLSADQIAIEVATIVQANLKAYLGGAEAQKFGEQLATALVGSTSSIALKEAGAPNPSPDQIDPLDAALYQFKQEQIVINKLTENYFYGIIDDTSKYFTNPDLPVLQIANDNNTLARTYLKTMWTGLMYQEDGPGPNSGFGSVGRGVDFLV